MEKINLTEEQKEKILNDFKVWLSQPNFLVFNSRDIKYIPYNVVI